MLFCVYHSRAIAPYSCWLSNVSVTQEKREECFPCTRCNFFFSCCSVCQNKSKTTERRFRSASSSAGCYVTVLGGVGHQTLETVIYAFLLGIKQHWRGPLLHYFLPPNVGNFCPPRKYRRKPELRELVLRKSLAVCNKLAHNDIWPDGFSTFTEMLLGCSNLLVLINSA